MKPISLASASFFRFILLGFRSYGADSADDLAVHTAWRVQLDASLAVIPRVTRPSDASLAVYEAGSASILLVFLWNEADPHFLQYETDSAANLPLILLYEADRAAILLLILKYYADSAAILAFLPSYA